MNEPQTASTSGASTSEDRFFGVKTTISTDDSDAPPIDEIEVVDESTQTASPPATDSGDDDAELTSYSEKVQKRIKKLTWEKNEERRQREQAEALQKEAVRFAQQLTQRNQQYEHIITNGEGYLIKQFQDRAAAMMEQAKSKYRKAYEEGDTDAVIAAQEEMLNAKAELFVAGQREQDYRQRYQQWQQQQQQPVQPQPVAQPVAASPTERARQWGKENPWFYDPKHKDMQSLAFGIHERLVREEGVRPDTDEYFDAIDREVRRRFPEYFNEAQGQVAPASTRRNPSTVVAPAARNNGAMPRQVKLTQTQLSLAKRLGLTPEQYARELTKDMYNG